MSAPTKIVRCTDCGSEIIVQKWAPRNQACTECRKASTNPTPATASDIANPTPRDKCEKAQETLNALGFEITSRGYNKMYQQGNELIRMEPYFEKGMMDDYALEAILVTRQELIAIRSSDFAARIPEVARTDIHALLTALNIDTSNLSPAQVHIDTVKCSGCGQQSSNWIQLANGRVLCLDRCAPVQRPYGKR